MLVTVPVYHHSLYLAFFWRVDIWSIWEFVQRANALTRAQFSPKILRTREKKGFMSFTPGNLRSIRGSFPSLNLLKQMVGKYEIEVHEQYLKILNSTHTYFIYLYQCPIYKILNLMHIIVRIPLILYTLLILPTYIIKLRK